MRIAYKLLRLVSAILLLPEARKTSVSQTLTISLASVYHQGLLLNIKNPASEELLANCVWSLSNMCRGKPAPGMDVSSIESALPVKLVYSELQLCLRDVVLKCAGRTEGTLVH